MSPRTAGRRSRTRWCGGWPGCSRPTSGYRGSARSRPRSTPASPRLWRRYEYRVCDRPEGAPPLRAPGHPGLAPAARPGRAQRRLGRAERRTRFRGLLPAQGERHDRAGGEPTATGGAIRTGSWSRPSPPTRSARPWCAAWSGRCCRSATAAARSRWPAALLTRRERANEVVVAPPHGLTLVEVGYPDDPAELCPPGRAHPQPSGLSPTA